MLRRILFSLHMHLFVKCLLNMKLLSASINLSKLIIETGFEAFILENVGITFITTKTFSGIILLVEDTFLIKSVESLI